MIASILPVMGCEQMPFGMDRSRLQSSLGGRVRSPARHPDEDYFQDEGLFAYFDNEQRLKAVEFFAPAQAWLDNWQLLGMPLGQAKRILQSVGGVVVDEDAGATCFNIGIGLYAPFARDDPDDPVETVIVFRQGYYDEG